MKYSDYEALGSTATAENALSVVMQMLEKVKSDAMETEALTTAYEGKLSFTITTTKSGAIKDIEIKEGE